jgi:hypothetical protein
MMIGGGFNIYMVSCGLLIKEVYMACLRQQVFDACYFLWYHSYAII